MSRASFEILVPVRTTTGQNARGHWAVKAARVKRERAAVSLFWLKAKPPKLAVPFVVTLTRISPGQRADADNVVGGLKATKDQVADQLGVDDGDELAAQWLFTQQKGPWGVRVRVEGEKT